MMKFALSAVALAAVVAAPLACSSSSSSSAPDPDAGIEGGDQGVPSVALSANAATDCPAAFATSAPKQGLNKGYPIEGQQREFDLRLPAETSTPRPLLVGFNGTGQDGPEVIDAWKLEDFVARGFIVLAPSSAGNGTTWPVWDSLRTAGKENDPNKDLTYFDSVVKCVAAHYPVDANRIYIAGHSAGGIMANHVLQRRSTLLAGGIVASGLFSLTSPQPAAELDPMFVVVTWGGDNDQYKGTAGGSSVGGFNFLSEASIASKYYDAQPKVQETNCRGNNVGHKWLADLNPWFIDELLAHPKGLSGKGVDGPLPAVPATANAVCSDTPYAGPETAEVTCQPSAKTGCQEVCQLFADCAVENVTIGSALTTQLSQIGFSGPGNTSCIGCVTKCEATAKTPADDEVLACFKTKLPGAQCTQGVDGGLPLIRAVNECCNKRTDSAYCVDTCKIINTNGTAAAFFTTCAEIAK